MSPPIKPDRPLKRPPTSGTRRGNGSGQGAAWGGPAKGAAVERKERQNFQQGNTMGSLPPNLRAEERRRRSAEMEDVIYRLAMDAEREETRLAAARALKAEYDGSPIARTVTYNANELSDLDDGALEARRAELEGRLRAGVGGNDPPPVGKPH